MTPFLIVVAILVCHSGGNFLHAEKRFVEVGHAEMVIRMNGDMPDFRKHSNSSSMLGFFSKMVASVNSAREARFEFRLSSELGTRDAQLVSVIHGRRKNYDTVSIGGVSLDE